LASATIVSRKQKIRDYILPKIGHLPAKAITGADIVQMLEAVADKSPKLVKPVMSSTRLIFAHGIAKHVVSGDPCAGITVKAIAGDTSKGEASRVMLTDAELKTVFSVLPKYGRINELVIRILLSTAARIQALMLAEWSHIDFVKKEWLIPPGDGRKSEREFLVPLTDELVGYFAELQTLAGNSRFVLPVQKRIRGREGDAPMRQHTINQALVRLCKELESRCRKFSPHDLRSTARSHFAALGVSLVVAERCLNHSLGGLVATYDQHDYMTERRRALELWSAKLAALESGADNVIPLAGKVA
jgi:integrase